MRKLSTIALVVTVVLFAGSATAQDADTEAAIGLLAQSFTEAWAAGDAARCASIYADDAEFMDITGQLQSGKAAIEQNLAATLEQYGSSSLALETTAMHTVKPDLVVVDGTWEVSGSSAELPMKGFYTIVVTNVNGEWLVASNQSKVAPQ